MYMYMYTHDAACGINLAQNDVCDAKEEKAVRGIAEKHIGLYRDIGYASNTHAVIATLGHRIVHDEHGREAEVGAPDEGADSKPNIVPNHNVRGGDTFWFYVCVHCVHNSACEGGLLMRKEDMDMDLLV